MKNIIQKSVFPIALTAMVGAGSAAYAVEVDTDGGLSVASDDGNFEFEVGGRIHLDGYIYDEDLTAGTEDELTSTTNFRRAWLTLEGMAWNWGFKFENDFAGQDDASGFQDMYISRDLGAGTLYIGQFKPYRGMEELTSSNEITMMERPFASGSGIYEQYQIGLGFRGGADNFTYGVSGYNLRDADGDRTDGLGGGGRLTFAPVNSDGAVVHVGGSASYDKVGANGTRDAEVTYPGRLGIDQLIAETLGREEAISYAGELAGVAGPFYAQAEYALVDYGQDLGEDQEAQTYYVQASWHLTGESKPYDSGKGVFKSVKPRNSWGALELTARYDFIENKDLENAEVTVTTVGLNYYVNKNVRFMLNYQMAENEFTGDEPDQVSARAQFAF